MTAPKKQTITPKPVSKELQEFVASAAHVDGSADAKKNKPKKDKPKKPNKVQVPLLLPKTFLDELDDVIERSGTGVSRSAWICQAIRERLDSGK